MGWVFWELFSFERQLQQEVSKLMKLMALILTLLLVICLAKSSNKHNNTIILEGNINQPIQINLPYTHVLEVKAADPKYDQLIHFSPNRFRFATLKQFKGLPSSQRSLLQQLRTPFSNQYTHIFHISNQTVTFRPPNQFIFLQETKDSYEITKNMQISMMGQGEVRFHTLAYQYIFMFLNESELIVVRSGSYLKQTNPFNSSEVVFFQGKNDDLSFYAYSQPYVHIFVVQQGKVVMKGTVQKPIKLETSEHSSIKAIKTLDIQGEEKAQMWILDSTSGLYYSTLHTQTKAVSEPVLLAGQQGCFEMDFNRSIHLGILLTCSLEGESTFITLEIDNSSPNKPILVKRSQPYFQSCHNKKYLYYQNSILSLEKQSIDIYLPLRPKEASPQQYVKNWLNLPPTAVFHLPPTLSFASLQVQMILQSSLLKQSLEGESYTLQVKSNQTVQTGMLLNVSYLCEAEEICQSSVWLQVNIHNQILSYVQRKSVNLGVMLLFGTALLAVALLCFRKYRDIQARALMRLKTLTSPNQYTL